MTNLGITDAYWQLDGCHVADMSMPELLNCLAGLIATGKPHQLTVINANKLFQMQQSPALADILHQSHFVLPEWAIVWAARILGHPLKGHLGGSMVAERLIEFAADGAYSLYFVGAQPEVLGLLIGRLSRRHPNLRIAGWDHGYFQDEGRVVSRIAQARPDILLVGLGSPRQELFIHRNLRVMNVPVAIGVGGTFDVLAGVKKDAPQWLRGTGLEWLWRLGQDPRNLWRRYLVSNPWFVCHILKLKFALGRSK